MGLFSGTSKNITVVEYRTRTGSVAKTVVTTRELEALRSAGHLVAELGDGSNPTTDRR
jgi:hypothetical protein